MPFPGTILANYQLDKINRRQVRNAYICIKMHIYILPAQEFGRSIRSKHSRRLMGLVTPPATQSPFPGATFAQFAYTEIKLSQ